MDMPRASSNNRVGRMIKADEPLAVAISTPTGWEANIKTAKKRQVKEKIKERSRKFKGLSSLSSLSKKGKAR